MTFVILLIVFCVALRPLHRKIICRRLVRQAGDRLRSLTLVSDALTLEVTLADTRHGYDIGPRWRQWNERYHEALRMAEAGCGMGFVRTVRLLHLQTESLWRIRPILSASGS